MRDVTASCEALETRIAPMVFGTLSPVAPATSSRTAVPRGGTLTAIDCVAFVFGVLLDWKYSICADAEASYDGLKTRRLVTKVCCRAFVTRPATGTSYS